MRAAILAAVLLFTACGPPPDLVSKHGVKFYMNGAGAGWTNTC